MRVGLHAGQLLHRSPGGIGRYVGALLEHLPRLGVDVVPFSAGRPHESPEGHVDLGRPRGRWRYEVWHRFRRPRLRLDVDVVHATSLAVPPSGPAPLVVTIHDLAFLESPDFHTRRGNRFHRRGLELARRDASAVVVPSRFVATELEAAGFEPSRVVVAPHGVDVPADPPAETAAARLDRLGVAPPYLLHVGAAEPRKGTDSLLEALPAVRSAHSEVQLVLASPGGWGRFAPAEGARALGGVAETDLDALYRSAEALVYPSRHEGFGMPVLEAMARGCPVVTSNRSSLPEVAGDAALLVDPDDVAALRDTLLRVLDDGDLRARLAAAGRSRAAAFTWEASARAHLTAYRLAAGGADDA